MDHLKILDEILLIFKNSSIPALTPEDIHKKLSYDLTHTQVKEAMRELTMDFYLKPYNETYFACVLTFSGEVFVDKGGYVAEYESSSAERRLTEERILKSQQNEIRALLLSKRLNFLTAGLILATLLLMFWDVYKYYHPIPSEPIPTLNVRVLEKQ